MPFSILHISDLHRDVSDEVGNPWLLKSLINDFIQHNKQEPKIIKPALCIISGDLVYGVNPTTNPASGELQRQYKQAEEFLVGLADQLFNGDRERIVILPGNHDVCYEDVLNSVQKIEIPTDGAEKKKLVAELFAPNTLLRWSWAELCFYKIIDEHRYQGRFQYFETMYNNFYQGIRTFSRSPEKQYNIFDFPELKFCVVALNSCYNNDPFRRAGAFHPTALAEACQALNKPDRAGWLTAMAWHHNFVGSPFQDDYLNAELIQLFIGADVSLGFHGHQHMAECVEERSRIGQNTHKMTIISAGTLCAGPHSLKTGEPRSYNIVELDTASWSGCVHKRQMVNHLLDLPVWGPGHFNSTNTSYVKFDVSKPALTRPAHLDLTLTLERAEELIGSKNWNQAVNILADIKDVPLARPLLAKALGELADPRRTIKVLWPPVNTTEAVILGGAIFAEGTPKEAKLFIELKEISKSTDASVIEIARRIRERRIK